ncbi:AbrB family transcriptional regulator [Neobacillus cucumis]|uniref:AbrB family transcriptional regulator n=1 Tax=Neobacillus cucumis TaxID=1740721 RepID=UPI0018E05EC2|nr:AbrB family transcriptional regulator [Neobacillus cucumis]MBI0581272.1 AbrB family transcriptional regulator [Neobacillus cucumis]
MNGKNTFLLSVCFILISSLGGFLISLTGLSIGWMIGTFLAAAFLSFWRPSFLKGKENQKGMPKYWLFMGQFILGIHLGQKINLTFLHVFKENWLAIILMLLLSIIFSLLSGLVLWKYSNTDMMTSFFGTAPGGLSAMPGIAEEAGANTAVVSIIQTMRVFLVILMIPLITSISASHSGNSANHASLPVLADPGFKIEMLLWTFVFMGFAYAGYWLIKFLRFPAPWLIGSMVGVAIGQSLASFMIGSDIVSWWPHEVIILSQIMIAASIGSRFQKSMFIGLKRTIIVSFLSTVGLIFSMFMCAVLVAKITGISLITSILAFAPGGIAEMTTTSVVLHGDSTFVVAVQVLRILIICVILPQFFRLLNYLEQKKHFLSNTSV